MISSREALVKALIWRFGISIPGGVLITYLWIGELATATALMLFMNALFTVFHYFFEMSWPNLWNKVGRFCKKDPRV